MSDIHLIKLCVGPESLNDLLRYEKDRGETYRIHTRNRPMRHQELVAGGSLYWVIKGQIVCRREIVRFEIDEDSETPLCWIHLRNHHIATVPQPKRPFQGWRYLKAADAPPDLSEASGDGLSLELAQVLKEQGVW